MYNPNYLGRPYVVVLNKIDLPEVCAFYNLLSLVLGKLDVGWLLQLLFQLTFKPRYKCLINHFRPKIGFHP